MFKQGKVNVGPFKDLDADLFMLSFKAKDEFVIATENDKTVVLDITIDKELMKEGLAREIIRTIQVLRKEAGFKVEERISIAFKNVSDTIKDIVNKFKTRIKTEVLAKDKEEDIVNPTIEKEVEIGDEKFVIELKN